MTRLIATTISLYIMTGVGVAQATHMPVEFPIPSGLEPEGTARVFYQASDWNFLLETTYRSELENRKYFHARAGGYYRLLSHLKVGAFFQRMYGARHDDDWTLVDGAWAWGDTNARAENVLIFDVTPRMEILGLIAEVKTRFSLNTFNQHQALKVRPGLMWFSGRWTVFGRYEMYFPLNFSTASIYEKWIYLGGLYRFADWIEAGMSGARRTITWTPGETFKALNPTEDYTLEVSSWVVALNLIFRLGQ